VSQLKVSDREFTNARQLIFAIHDETDSLDLDEITTRFAEEIRKKPWAVRVTTRRHSIRRKGSPICRNISHCHYVEPA